MLNRPLEVTDDISESTMGKNSNHWILELRFRHEHPNDAQHLAFFQIEDSLLQHHSILLVLDHLRIAQLTVHLRWRCLSNSALAWSWRSSIEVFMVHWGALFQDPSQVQKVNHWLWNCVAQPSRLRVLAASRRHFFHNLALRGRAFSRTREYLDSRVRSPSQGMI